MWPSFEARKERAPPAIMAKPLRGDDGGNCYGISMAPSPSLPRRDDLDFVAIVERRLGPAAARQHVEIQRDGKMRALIVELIEQRIDPRRGDFPRFAVDDHAHCITSLSIT